MNPGYEEVVVDGTLFAIVIRRSYRDSKVTFFTSLESPQQIGYIPQKTGGVIAPHVHKPLSRTITKTNETLFVRTGRMKVNLYTEAKALVRSLILEAGDVILLCGGGHGFEFLEDTELIEVKQGPYAGVDDKERFVGVEKQGKVSA